MTNVIHTPTPTMRHVCWRCDQPYTTEDSFTRFCDDCKEANRADNVVVRARVDAKTWDALTDLYGYWGGYGLALINLAESQGFVVHPNQRRRDCLRRLDNPNHRCTGRYLSSCGRAHEAGLVLDHTVYLRRGPAIQPEQWALLSQPYAYRSAEGLERSPIHLGPAPYGGGTYALLYLGRKASS